MKPLKIAIAIGILVMVYNLVYQIGYNRGKVVEQQHLVGRYQPYIFMDQQFDMLRARYGCLKNTPWDEFTIEQKMILCVVGSSENHFREKDVEELLERWGPK